MCGCVGVGGGVWVGVWVYGCEGRNAINWPLDSGIANKPIMKHYIP